MLSANIAFMVHFTKIMVNREANTLTTHIDYDIYNNTVIYNNPNFTYAFGLKNIEGKQLDSTYGTFETFTSITNNSDLDHPKKRIPNKTKPCSVDDFGKGNFFPVAPDD